MFSLNVMKASSTIIQMLFGTVKKMGLGLAKNYVQVMQWLKVLNFWILKLKYLSRNANLLLLKMLALVCVHINK